MIQFRRPCVKPLLRANAPLPAVRGSVFRVTQQFLSRDFYWNDGRTHQAVDIGDFGCGAAIVAMAPGTVYRIQDNASALGAASNALGVRIDHGQGYTTEYWHLGGWTVANGAKVTAGQQVGIVGNTGLGAVCHCHVEAKLNGVKFDPEPLMFGGSVGEDDMKLPAGLSALTYATLGAGNRLRADPDTIEGSQVTDADQRVQVFGVVPGAKWTVGPKTGTTYYFVGLGLDGWYVATALLPGVQLTALGEATLPPQTGFTQVELDAAKAAGFESAKTKAEAAVERIRP